jgi:hypothetical protein
VEKLELHDVDTIVSFTKMLAISIRDKTSVLCPLSTGQVAGGPIHPDWQPVENLSILGRTLDLKAAYKQLGVSSDSLWTSILLVPEPQTGIPRFFLSRSLMFGSTAAVYGFNRAARAIWFVAVKMLRLMALNFYDDYPSFEPECTANNAWSTFETLLRLLGWSFAQDDDKRLSFAAAFSALGVRLDLANVCTAGQIVLSNKESRVASIVHELQEILAAGKMSAAHAASLVGKLQYMQGQYLGRSLVPAIWILCHRQAGKLTSLCTEALQHVLFHCRNAKAKTLEFWSNDDPVVIFTDGAWEGKVGTFGVCVFDSVTNKRLVFDGSLPCALAEVWMNHIGEQLITQIELLPVILAKQQLGPMLEGRRVLWFIDNDPARFSLIRGASQSSVSMRLLFEFWSSDTAHPCFNWFARVPSYSNPADLPSRRMTDQCLKMFNASYGGSLELPVSMMQYLSTDIHLLDGLFRQHF